MKCAEIIKIIEKTYPVTAAEEWDNVGLLAGRDDKEVHKIYIALDATDEVIDEAVRCGADMLVTHHPLIFGGLKRVTNRNFIENRVLRLLQNDISYYAMHTNYDVKRMADLACEKLAFGQTQVLEATGADEAGNEEGIGKIASIAPVTLEALCAQVKEAFGLESVKVFGDSSATVSRAAICPGSGKSVIKEALKKGADVFITGDIGHHEGIDAVAQGLSIIDAGHYGIEHIFIEDMRRFLEEHTPETEVQTAGITHPFVMI